jgi:hypothetical protein
MEKTIAVRIYPQRTVGLNRPGVNAKKEKPGTRRIPGTVRDSVLRINRLFREALMSEYSAYSGVEIVQRGTGALRCLSP